MKLNLLSLAALIVLLIVLYAVYPCISSMFLKKEKFETYKECIKRTGSEAICK